MPHSKPTLYSYHDFHSSRHQIPGYVCGYCKGEIRPFGNVFAAVILSRMIFKQNNSFFCVLFEIYLISFILKSLISKYSISQMSSLRLLGQPICSSPYSPQIAFLVTKNKKLRGGEKTVQ